MRISDWSSDVCSSDLEAVEEGRADADRDQREHVEVARADRGPAALEERPPGPEHDRRGQRELHPGRPGLRNEMEAEHVRARSEEHTSELQSLMRTSYAVFCLKKKIKQTQSQLQT